MSSLLSCQLAYSIEIERHVKEQALRRDVTAWRGNPAAVPASNSVRHETCIAPLMQSFSGSECRVQSDSRRFAGMRVEADDI